MKVYQLVELLDNLKVDYADCEVRRINYEDGNYGHINYRDAEVSVEYNERTNTVEII